MSRNILRGISIVLFGLLLTLSKRSEASHAMGADLTYQCMGGNTYKIRLSFYRDCIGINAPANVYINVNSISCGQSLGVTCYPLPGTGQEVKYLCPTAQSTCAGGSFTGIQEYVYEGVITLPMQCVDWAFSYTLCCRNAAITTISTPGTNTFYVYASLNNTVSPCNSSPTFSNKPVPFTCLGQQFCFNHGAVDADGDSLVYSLVDPRQTAAAAVGYLSPYNASNPLNSNPALQFNTQTGDICFTPQQLEVTVMAVLMQEYRNGVLIGSVVRDIQVTVINCNNNLPTLSGINGTNDYDMTVCANQPFCFDIFSNDVDAGQQVSLFSNNGISGGTFTSAGTPHPTGHFCWFPTTGDISTAPYCFTVRVNDDACPYIGSQTYSYCITVQGIVVDAGPDQYIACSDIATITAGVTGGTPPYSYLWSNGYTGATQTVPVGTYIVTVSDGTCSNTDTINIESAFEPTANFSWTGSCVFGPIQFTDLSNTPGGFSDWTWDFGDGSGSTLQNPVHNYNTPGIYNVSLIVENIYGCVDTLIQQVTINPPPVPDFAIANACAGSGIQITNTSTPPGTTWDWTFSSGGGSTSMNPVIVIGTPGTYSATLIVGDSAACKDTLTKTFVVNPVPTASFGTSGSVCESSSVTFNNTSTGGVSYHWEFGDGDTSNLQNPTHIYSTSGNFNVTLIVTNSSGCTDTIVQSLPINGAPFADAGPDRTICLGNSVTLSASGGVTYNWNPGGSGSSISVSPSSNASYEVTVTDANGCTSKDTVNVNVNPLPVATVSTNQAICAGQSVTLTAGGGSTYNWNPSGATTSTITITPGSSTTYAVDVIDGNGCQSTAFVNITVNPVPAQTLQTPVFICGGASEILDPGPNGVSYQWSTGATTQTISVNTQGIYSVTITNSFGCTTVATTQVTVGGQVVSNNNAIAICAGQSTTLDAGYAGSTYLWSTGATTQTINVNTSGTFAVTITDPNGCSGTVNHTVNVHPLPIPAFTPIDVCITQPVSFHDISTVNGDTIVSWSWDLGDGNISFQQDPVHAYSNSNSYPVTLTVTTSAGCSATLADTVNVYPLPIAIFNVNHDCEGTAIQFDEHSITSMGNITGWNWDFGDASTSNLQNPVHIYNAPGTYNVTLTVSTAGGCSDTKVHQIQIYPQPLMNFNPTASSVCGGSTVNFTNLSTSSNGAINNWLWNFGDATTSAQQNPSHVYSTPGTYNVTLIGTTSHGCMDTVTKPVTINALPIADAGLNTSICLGSSATLTATGGGSYQWSTGQLTSSITVTPGTNTTYYVTVTNAAGCTSKDSVAVSIKSLPIANAGPDKSICIGGSTTLTATGGGTYSWNPGGAINPTIPVSPAVTTTYIVTVTGANGCTRKDTAIVTVNNLPVPNAGPDQAICQGTTATLTASGGTTYLWQHSGATTATVYVNPTAASSYIVTVSNAAGCSAKDTVNLTINPTPVVNVPNAFFCAGFNAVLDAGNPGMSYLWSPNGEITQTINVATAGPYSVTVTNAFGCVGTASTNVVEGGTGISANPNNYIVCQGNSVTLNAGNPGMNYLWSTGAGTQTISVNTTGSYSVTVTDAGGCSTTFNNNVTVNPVPVVDFSTQSGCLGSQTVFTDLSTVSTGTLALWQWNLGDGNSSSQHHPRENYPGAGNYTVSLVVTTGAGCVDSISHIISIDPLPVSDFSASTVCQSNGTQFTDLSTISSGVVGGWYWTFGDGATSTLQDPVHTYANAGNYIVNLVTSSGSGCKDTSTYSVNVNPMPVPDFYTADVCDGDSIHFTNASYINNGSISDVQWDFGDGNGSTLNDPAYLYATAGTYTVTLTIGSDLACQTAISKTVKVNDRPAADFATPPVCSGGSSVFTDQTTIAGGNINQWYWDFGDGGFSSIENPSHNYSGPGTYTVSMIATSDKGCKDSAARVATVNTNPAGAFTSSNICAGNATQFTDNSSITSGSLSGWLWSFGDNTTSNAQNPSHIYTTPGTYPVQLIVSSGIGCTDTIQQSINVFPVPVADFSSGNVCMNSQTAFYDLSSVQGGSQFSYNWNFGDNSTDTSSNPSHSYLQPGTYNVTLSVSTGYGCSNSVMKQVTVYHNPTAAFTAANVCLDQFTEFMDGSGIPVGSIAGWYWTFGDSTSSTAQNPTHFYQNAGGFNVSLDVTSNNGCKANVLNNVLVYFPPTPVIATGSGCVGNPIPFADTSSGLNNNVTAWDWDFGNGNTSSNSSPSIVFNTAGTHPVSLTTTNINGCQATTTAMVTVSPLPVASFTSGSACENSGMSFNSTSTIANGDTIASYAWNFGDGTGTSNTANPVYTYTTAGTYTVTLITTSTAGCSDTTTGQVTVNPLPVANFLQVSAAGCGPVPVQFYDSSYVVNGNIVSWSWDFGDGQTSNLQDPLHLYTNSGTYSVSLTVESDSGCTNTTVRNNIITVYPSPNAEFTPDPDKQTILNPIFNFINQTTGGQTYTWTFGDGGNSFDFEPTHTYADTGNYMVTLWVVNSYGCRDSVEHPVRVDPIFSWWIPNAFTPNEDGINDGFNVTGEYIVDVRLHIFNRWGDEIFFSEGRENSPWDGSIIGKEERAQEGVYVYLVEVKDVWGKLHEKVGHVSLVR